ncbi:MAG TPA: tRNA (adenosine(37)-N6)-threonylcarbamoyltransferase complex dimerization subunit type 1 TsaB [Mycobacteriales bacterium]|nr:tRNA (adenosine(37)-N6)-threonylcarbamoyltransferase complex dimerization subunit type 1 TsaB [Mycobacteriales bacterium]
MLALGLDTATPAISVALVDGEETVAARREVAANRHGERLAPLIAEVLREAGATPADLVAIGAGVGPGPFTGLRVGIVTAQSMADALGIPAYGECSLDLIAATAPVAGQPFVVMTDARRHQVYWAAYDAAGERVAGPDIAPPESVADRIDGDRQHVVGPGAPRYREHYPDAAAAAFRAARRAAAGEPGERLRPLYLRRPDARPPSRPKRVLPA